MPAALRPNFRPLLSRLGCALLFACLACTAPARAIASGDDAPKALLATDSIEYFNAALGHYFVTGFLEEIDKLDSGAIPGWTRTGQKFGVWFEAAGARVEVCRFFSAYFAPKSSHFYTALAHECALLKTGIVWQYEGVVAYVVLPAPDGSCDTGIPLYRLYNNVLTGAPNHRYTKSTSIRDQMIALGWTSEGFGPEGVIACVPKG